MRHFADNTFSVGIEDEIFPADRLRIISGLSYNLRKSGLAENYDSETGTLTEFDRNQNTAINAQVAAYYRFSGKFSLSFTAAHKTRFATMKDRYSYRMGRSLPNLDLKAETALNLEIASKIKAGNRIVLEPALFYSRLNNTIQMVDNVEPGILQLQNTGKAKFNGAELSFRYFMLKNLCVTANYAYIERENITNHDIKFTDVPRHSLFAYLDCSLFGHFDFVFSSGYSSNRFSTSYGVVSPEFWVCNTQASYRFTKYLTAKAGIDNLLDNNYTIAEGYPEEGRNYYLSLIFSLK